MRFALLGLALLALPALASSALASPVDAACILAPDACAPEGLLLLCDGHSADPSTEVLRAFGCDETAAFRAAACHDGGDILTFVWIPVALTGAAQPDPPC